MRLEAAAILALLGWRCLCSQRISRPRQDVLTELARGPQGRCLRKAHKPGRPRALAIKTQGLHSVVSWAHPTDTLCEGGCLCGEACAGPALLQTCMPDKKREESCGPPAILSISPQALLEFPGDHRVFRIAFSIGLEWGTPEEQRKTSVEIGKRKFMWGKSEQMTLKKKKTLKI